MDQYSFQIKTETDSVAISVDDVISDDNVLPDDKSALKHMVAGSTQFAVNNNSFKNDEPENIESVDGIKIYIKTELDSLSELDEAQWLKTCSTSGSKFEEAEYSLKTESTWPDETEANIKTEVDSSAELSDDEFIDTCVKAEELSSLDSNEYGEYIDDNDDQYKKLRVKEEELDIKDEDHEDRLKSQETPWSNKLDTKDVSRKIFQCNLCNFKTSIYGSLKKHLLLHEDPIKIPLYYCTKCNYRTKQKCHLKRHDLVHQDTEEIPMYSCNICGTKTKQKCTLKRHIESVHMKSHLNILLKNELFTCNECPFQTHKKGLMLSHMDKHKDTSDMSNLFICDICSFSTKYRKNLRMHLDTHKDPKKLQFYQCELCNFSSRMPKCLTRHFLSKKHLKAAGKLEEYRPRCQKL